MGFFRRMRRGDEFILFFIGFCLSRLATYVVTTRQETFFSSGSIRTGIERNLEWSVGGM